MIAQTAITVLAAEALEDVDALLATETVRSRHVRLVALRAKIASILSGPDDPGA